LFGEPTSIAAYADRFRCIGPLCEDTCCQGWKIPVDAAALDLYKKLPGSQLKSQIIGAIIPAPAALSDSGANVAIPCTDAAAQSVLRLREDGHCALLNSDSLCTIHAKLGEAYLPSVCATYPRVQRQFGSHRESALALSCPEAARQVLLSPSLLSPALLSPSLLATAEQPQRSPSESISDTPPCFAGIRSTMIALIGSRNLPLWQRLVNLGLLCQRLDSIEAGQLSVDLPNYLATFCVHADSGFSVSQMESMTVDPQAQLDVVLRLAGLMLHRSRVTPRFAECIAAFTSGIGNGPTATLATVTAAYNRAFSQWFDPFVRRHPHVLENYLINLIVLRRFPFGPASDSSSTNTNSTGSQIFTQTRSGEFARLAAQFVLIRGILIGVAGHYRDRFSSEHVVHTVQAISKHFEHHPKFLSSAQALVAESGLDGIAGLSILLRNGPADTQFPAVVAVPAPIPASIPVSSTSRIK
jgi:lysine-N-methylase